MTIKKNGHIEYHGNEINANENGNQDDEINDYGYGLDTPGGGYPPTHMLWQTRSISKLIGINEDQDIIQLKYLQKLEKFGINFHVRGKGTGSSESKLLIFLSIWECLKKLCKIGIEVYGHPNRKQIIKRRFLRLPFRWTGHNDNEVVNELWQRPLRHMS